VLIFRAGVLILRAGAEMPTSQSTVRAGGRDAPGHTMHAAILVVVCGTVAFGRVVASCEV
jgi:hypothetical protein